MSQITNLMVTGDHPVLVEPYGGAAIVTVATGGATVFYSDNRQVTPTSNQGSITAGNTATFTKDTWIVAASTATPVTVVTTTIYDAPGGTFGKLGAKYGVVAGPIQNAGPSSYFQPITIANHQPIGFDSVTTTAGTVTAPGVITIDYTSLGATEVVSLIVVPDETLAAAGYMAGASVGLTLSNIFLTQASAVSDQVTYNGTNFVPSKTGATACFVNPGTFTTGTLTLTHPPVGGALAVSLEPRSIDGTTRPYQPVIAQSAGVGASSTNIEFWNQATGVKVTTADTNMKLTVTRPGFAQVNPQAVDTTAYPNSNLWVLGIFRIN